MFWKKDADSINYLQELTEQKRVEDPWFNDVLFECRDGNMSYESYCFLLGLPTCHPGSWRQGNVSCGSLKCADLPLMWQDMKQQGQS
jgi:hypothetical protein